MLNKMDDNREMKCYLFLMTIKYYLVDLISQQLNRHHLVSRIQLINFIFFHQNVDLRLSVAKYLLLLDFNMSPSFKISFSNKMSLLFVDETLKNFF
jgi:hypothetical protein